MEAGRDHGGTGAGPQWFSLTGLTWTDSDGTVITAPTNWQSGTDKLWRDFHIVYNAVAQNEDLADYLSGLEPMGPTPAQVAAASAA